jgi:2-amino-4-hydroxy-6-hydroxymethyldihydropteridine diphosphokinase
MKSVDAAVGLGSNLGDRRSAIQNAVHRLVTTPGIRVSAASSLYESEPWGYRDQPAFLNAVVKLVTTLGPEQLLGALQQIERDVGRTKTFRWGPREIDLDLLVYGDQTIDQPGLVVPHPRILERSFVLAPLAEIWPDVNLPRGISARDALQAVDPDRRSIMVVGPLATSPVR